MHHALLVAGLVQPEVFAVLQQGLADAGDIAVAEDADGAAEERLGVAVPLDPLGGEEANDGLADGQAGGVVVLGTMSFPVEGGGRGVSSASPGSGG